MTTNKHKEAAQMLGNIFSAGNKKTVTHDQENFECHTNATSTVISA